MPTTRIVYGASAYQIGAELRTFVTRHGITWTFSKQEYVGYYANGDPYVYAPNGVTIVAISPQSAENSGISGWIQHGSMINPSEGDVQGYDSRSANTFDISNNVAMPGADVLDAGNPLVVPAGSSLVSTRSKGTPDNWPQLLDASVLTVVDTYPAPGSFRPPYSGTDKTATWTTNDIDWAWLESRQVARASLDPADLPDIESLYSQVERVWLDHNVFWTFTRLQPENNMPSYGREISKVTGDVALAISLDYSREELFNLVVAYTQLGIDLYGVAVSGGVWNADGGIYCGRKIPVVFAGQILGSAAIQAYGNAATHFIFQEDQQTYEVTQTLIDTSQSGLISEGGCWHPDTRGGTVAYEQADLGLPEWGIRFSQWRGDTCSTGVWAPDASWDAFYRLVVSGPYAGTALAGQILGLTPNWNWDYFFDYIDRYVEAGENSVHSNWPGQAGQTNGPTNLSAAMWQAFRDSYPPVWSGS